MKRLALAAAAIAALGMTAAATAGGTGSAGAAAKPCTANAEVGPKGKIAFGFSCRKTPVKGIAIDAMSEVRKVKPTLLVDPRSAAVKPPRCGVKMGDVKCKADIKPGAVITGWMSVAGDPCGASVTFYLYGDGKRRTIVPTGVPALC